MSRSPQASQLSVSIHIRTTRVDHHKLHNSHYLFRSERHESITTSFTTLTIYSDQNRMSRSSQASQLSLSIQIRTTRVDHHKLHNSHYLFRSEPQESITTSFTTLTIYSDQNHKSRSPQASQLSLSIQISQESITTSFTTLTIYRSEPQESITTSFTTLTIYSDQNQSRSPQASQLSLSIQIRTTRVDHHKLHNSHYLFRSEPQESITTSFTTLTIYSDQNHKSRSPKLHNSHYLFRSEPHESITTSFTTLTIYSDQNRMSRSPQASQSQYLFRSEPQESITTSFTTLTIYSDQNRMSRSPQASQLSLSIQIRTTRVDHHKLHNSHYLFRSEHESITTSFTTLTIYSDQNHKSRSPQASQSQESITTSFTTLTIYSDQNHKSRSPQASQLSLSIQIRTTRVDHHKLHNSHYLFRSEPQESITTSFTTLTIYSDQNGKSRSPQASQLSLSIQIRTA